MYDVEPPAANDALRTLPNVVLSPHLGYSTHAVFAQFYQTAVDNVLAFPRRNAGPRHHPGTVAARGCAPG